MKRQSLSGLTGPHSVRVWVASHRALPSRRVLEPQPQPGASVCAVLARPPLAAGGLSFRAEVSGRAGFVSSVLVS